MITKENSKLGSELCYADQQQVLRSYIHRYTREHIPNWAKGDKHYPKGYPLQFNSDQEWLKNTRFAVKKNGRLDRRFKFCESCPTWPDGVPKRVEGEAEFLGFTETS